MSGGVVKPSKLYIIGSLRNPKIPKIANELREEGFEVFDDWFAAGPEADDKWRDYERKHRRRTLPEALKGLAARHVYNFDMEHLEAADGVVLVLPAGKSAHMEFGWARRAGKIGIVLLAGEPTRYDVMYRIASAVVYSIQGVVTELAKHTIYKKEILGENQKDLQDLPTPSQAEKGPERSADYPVSGLRTGTVSRRDRESQTIPGLASFDSSPENAGDRGIGDHHGGRYPTRTRGKG